MYLKFLWIFRICIQIVMSFFNTLKEKRKFSKIIPTDYLLNSKRYVSKLISSILLVLLSMGRLKVWNFLSISIILLRTSRCFRVNNAQHYLWKRGRWKNSLALIWEYLRGKYVAIYNCPEDWSGSGIDINLACFHIYMSQCNTNKSKIHIYVIYLSHIYKS